MTESYDRYTVIPSLPPSIGVAMDAFSVPINEKNNFMFDGVRERIAEIENVQLRDKTMEFVNNLELATNAMRIDFNLPRILCDFRKRESYLEWIFVHFSIGFNVSDDGCEDGWFLISEDLNIDEHGAHLFVIPQIVDFIKRFGHER